MTHEQVSRFLQDHPEFFEQYADLLSEIYIPHPHGGRAISISERQIVTLRERSKQLEFKLREVVRFGEENDAIGEKVHRLALALLDAKDLESACAVARFNLREDFSVPHVEIRMWREDGSGPQGLATESSALREHAGQLKHATCGTYLPDDVAQPLFGETTTQVKSFALVPLISGDLKGVLALASEDAHRFYPEMGTVFLRRLGELIGTALGRHAA